MNKVKTLYNYFKSIWPSLKALYPNMYVVISEALDFRIFPTAHEAQTYAIRTYGRNSYLLQPI